MKFCRRTAGVLFFCMFFLTALPLRASQDTMKKEIALGEKVAADVEKQWERVADPALSARLSMLLGRFLPHLSRPLPYEVRIVREKMVNAFSLPGVSFTSPRACLISSVPMRRWRPFSPMSSFMQTGVMS